MKTILTNLAFPASVVTLPDGQNHIVSYHSNGPSKAWEFEPVDPIKMPGIMKLKGAHGTVFGTTEDELKLVTTGPRKVYQAIIRISGGINNFVSRVVGNGVEIFLPGKGERPDLYWTLDNDLYNTPIRLMELREGEDAKTQIWTLSAPGPAYTSSADPTSPAGPVSI